MGAPQIILIVIMALGLGVDVAKHREPQGPINALTTLALVIAMCGLLWWGGFFG